MICAKHDWWFTIGTICPKCAAHDLATSEAETVTAAETPESDLVSDISGGFDLAIPDFLQRAKDNTFAHPELMGKGECFDWTPNKDRCPEHRGWSEMSDAELLMQVDNSFLTLVERQPIYQELRHREDRKKSLPRIAALKEKKAAKDT